MKKSILIFCAALTTFSLMALGYVNSIHSSSDRKCNSEREKLVSVDGFKSKVDNLYASELFYNVDSRFLTTITKENLHNAKSIIDILPEKATKSVMSFRNVKVSVLQDDDPNSEMSERGNDSALNKAQLKLLHSTEYSNNIVIYADYTSMNENTGLIENNYLSYYISIVPEKQAEFKSGHDKLIEYIRRHSNEISTTISQNQLKPGRINFTVTDHGKISDIILTSTSGYDTFDESMIALISSLQGEWAPAKNAKGENINQELILFYGTAGC